MLMEIDNAKKTSGLSPKHRLIFHQDIPFNLTNLRLEMISCFTKD